MCVFAHTHSHHTRKILNSQQLQRVLSTPPGAGLHWRQTRAYLVADHVAWAPAAETEAGAEEGGGKGRTGTLTVRRVDGWMDVMDGGWAVRGLMEGASVYGRGLTTH